MTQTTLEVSPITVSKRGGGPSTDAGKSVSSKNAMKDGIWAKWLRDAEQSDYDTLVEQLLVEYADGTPTVRMFIDELATTAIKLKRIRSVENAHYQKASLLRAHRERQPHANSIASSMPVVDESSREMAINLAAAAALPDMETLDRLTRYETSCQKQMFRCLQALKVLKDERLHSQSRIVFNGLGSPRLAKAALVISEAGDR